MTSSQWHTERVREHLIREITWTITKKVNDPRIPYIITITDIKLAPDLRNATVFVSVFGSDEQKEKAHVALNGAAAFIQRCVAARIKMKHIPKLIFKIDSSLDRSEQINTILEQVKDDLV